MLTAIPGDPPGLVVGIDICSGRNSGGEDLANMRDNGRDVSQDNGQDIRMVRTLQAVGR